MIRVTASMKPARCASRAPARGMLVLGQILNADALQHSGDGVVYPRQRLFDGATRRQVAALAPLVQEVMKNGPSMAVNHLVGRNLARVPRQARSRRSCRHATCSRPDLVSCCRILASSCAGIP